MNNSIIFKALDREVSVTLEQWKVIVYMDLPHDALSVKVTINGTERTISNWRVCGFEDHLIEEEGEKTLLRKIYETKFSIENAVELLKTMVSKAYKASPESVTNSVKDKINRDEEEEEEITPEALWERWWASVKAQV